MKCKQAWMDVAEVIDSLRIIPRIVLFSFSGLLGYVIVATLHWYFRLPNIERSAQVTAVIAIIVPSLSGLAVWVYKIYSVGGRLWDGGTDSVISSSSTTLATSTVTK